MFYTWKQGARGDSCPSLPRLPRLAGSGKASI